MSSLNENLLTLYQTGHLSDVCLRFIDCHSKCEMLAVETHKFILYACGVKSLHHLIDTRFAVSSSSINIELDFTLYTPEIIRLFIGILYRNKLDCNDDTLSHEIYTNIFHFHQLSLYFQFTHLSNFCLQYLYDILSIECYAEILAYCLIRHLDADRYFVPQEKLPLFRQLIHWFVFCVDQHENDENLFSCNSSSVTKNLYLKEQKRKIDNFIVLPQKIISPNDVRYWRRICQHCLSQRPINDMGFLSNSRSKYLFYAIQENCRLTVLMKVESTQQQQQSDKKITTHLSLFSKSLTPTTTTEEFQLSHRPTRIAQIPLHPLKKCYVGTCDTCRKKKQIYIIDLSIIFEEAHRDNDG